MQRFAKGLYKAPRWQWLMLPLVLLYWSIVKLRHFLYHKGYKAQYKANIPVIIVGNISVGGNGKTPVVLALVEHFLRKNKRPVVLSRGYGALQSQFPYLVTSEDEADLVGDEPCLIRSRYPVSVLLDPKRARGIQFIEEHLNADVVICDDGLQHYSLARDIELCVIDERGLGNGFMLPMGPLREPASRLSSVDMILFNGQHQPTFLRKNRQAPVHQFELKASVFENLISKERLTIEQALAEFADKRIVALAGIGYPQRFFATLKHLRFVLTECIEFEDHYRFEEDDLPQAQLVLMTEKDAVKCRKFAHKNCWYLKVDATLPRDFYNHIDHILRPLHGV